MTLCPECTAEGLGTCQSPAMCRLTEKDKPMTTLADKVRKAIQDGEPTCVNCGAPRSNHPYRHPFVSSHTTTLQDLAPDLARAYLEVLAERDRLREALEEIAELPGRRWQRKTARAALNRDADQ